MDEQFDLLQEVITQLYSAVRTCLAQNRSLQGELEQERRKNRALNERLDQLSWQNKDLQDSITSLKDLMEKRYKDLDSAVRASDQSLSGQLRTSNALLRGLRSRLDEALPPSPPPPPPATDETTRDPTIGWSSFSSLSERSDEHIHSMR